MTILHAILVVIEVASLFGVFSIVLGLFLVLTYRIIKWVAEL